MQRLLASRRLRTAPACGRLRWLCGGPLAPELQRHVEGLRERYARLQDEVTSESFSAARMKELARLGAVAEASSELDDKAHEAAELHELAADADAEAELRALARAELPACESEVQERKERLLSLLVPPDASDDRDVVLEVRAGAGGVEAGLFAGELFDMYAKLARRRRWRFEAHEQSEFGAGVGGTREASAVISGEGVHGALRGERGVHRVQRVPATEALGR
eukprot:2095866-Prymnesium_polylepis.1